MLLCERFQPDRGRHRGACADTQAQGASRTIRAVTLPSTTDPVATPRPAGRTAEVFLAFLMLGLTSFGGPIAHLGYLREEFVRRRGWLDEAHYAQLLAVCQFLPGPASSQMGFAIGLLRGGWRGALAAFAGFTLPSALLMFGFAALAPSLGSGLGAAALHGLKLVAVVVEGVRAPLDAAIVAIGFALLAMWRVPALWVVAWCVVAALAAGSLAGV